MVTKPSDGRRPRAIVSLGKGKMSCMRSCYFVDVLLGCISPCRRTFIACLTGNFSLYIQYLSESFLSTWVTSKGQRQRRGCKTAHVFPNSGMAMLAANSYRKYYSTDTV